MDKETYDVLSEEKKIEQLVKSEEWALVRKKFIDAVLDLQSIRNIQLTDPQSVAIEVQSRNLAVNILMEWMQDVEGTAEKSKNSDVVVKRETYIYRTE